MPFVVKSVQGLLPPEQGLLPPDNHYGEYVCDNWVLSWCRELHNENLLRICVADIAINERVLIIITHHKKGR